VGIARTSSARGFATEAQLKARITATTNISKITKSMKMVSAAKLRGDQQRLAAAKPFAAWTDQVAGEARDLEDLPVDDFPQNNLLVVCSTDKGLCGGVNTILARMTRQLIAGLDAQGKKADIFVCGDKGRSALRRLYGDRFIGSATERVMPYSFDLASKISADTMKGEYDAVHIMFNKFKSAIAYVPSINSITPKTDSADEFFAPYEVEPENDPETLLSFHEYTLATKLFYAMLENATSEQSSRMSAMENASKNAGEMIEKFTLQYNRARQARITTELIEIISGASALEG
jgi:F-type H+-transporting ATPase subunit gamma